MKFTPRPTSLEKNCATTLASPVLRAPISFATTPESGYRYRSRSRQSLRRFDYEAPEPSPLRLFAELCLFDQTARRPISGHPRSRRSGAHQSRRSCSELYVKPDNGNALIPIRALTKAGRNVGLQSVNHLNQFTSVTFGFDTKPGVALGDVTDFIQENGRRDSCRRPSKANCKARGSSFSNFFGHCRSLSLLRSLSCMSSSAFSTRATSIPLLCFRALSRRSWVDC